jgi:hypothetical protein
MPLAKAPSTDATGILYSKTKAEKVLIKNGARAS